MVETFKPGPEPAKGGSEASKLDAEPKEHNFAKFKSKVDVPESHEVEYEGQLDSDAYYVIHRPKKDWNYKSFVVVVGNEKEQRTLKPTHVERRRDGGTTYIETSIGTFYFPAPSKQEKPRLLPIEEDEIE